MGKVLIIGAGGVATVAAHKVAQHPEVFDEIMIASRTKAKCDAIVKAIGNPSIQTAQVDADNVEELVELLNGYKPDMVMNLALPYQDLTIMEACLQTGCNYLDTANYRPEGRGLILNTLAVGLQETFRGSRTDRHSGLRFRPGRFRCVYGIRGQTLFR